MIMLGIDFGASRLRIAESRDDKAPELVNHRYADSSMPALFDISKRPSRQQDGSFQIASLKRALDFEQDLSVPGDKVNSMDYLAGILADSCAEYIRRAEQDEIHCVVAVPPCFSQRQRSAMRKAAIKAGFARVKLVDDTNAALLASSADIENPGNVLVYSWGASSFSAYLYRCHLGRFYPQAQEGDRYLGGLDIDTILAKYILKKLISIAPGAFSLEDLEVYQKIAVEAQLTKHVWANNEAREIKVSDLIGSEASDLCQETTISIPAKVCQAAMDAAIGRSIECVNEVLENGGATPTALLLSGGMAKIASVRNVLNKKLGLPTTIAGDEAVAIGATLYGMSLEPEDWEETEADRRLRKQLAPRQERPKPEERSASAGEPASNNSWARRYSLLLERAQLHESEGDHERAIEELEAAIDALSEISGELHRKAASLNESAGNHEKAIALLKEGNLRNPGNRYLAVDLVRLCYSQAIAARSRKRHGEAFKIVDDGMRAIRSLPDCERDYGKLVAQLHHLRGVLLCDENRWAEAKEELKESVRLEPDRNEYIELLNKIKKAVERPPQASVRTNTKRGRDRNKPCGCGSGKKYKKCCGS